MASRDKVFEPQTGRYYTSQVDQRGRPVQVYTDGGIQAGVPSSYSATPRYQRDAVPESTFNTSSSRADQRNPINEYGTAASSGRQETFGAQFDGTATYEFPLTTTGPLNAPFDIHATSPAIYPTQQSPLDYTGGYSSATSSAAQRTNISTSQLGVRDEGDARHVYAKNPSETFEKLDPRYKIIKEPHRFFKVGRVFKVLWTEPAGNTSDDEESFVGTSKYGERIYSKIRRFVVVRDQSGHCTCLPLTTYGGQGVMKRGINAKDHAAAYSEGERPKFMPGEERKMNKKPFPIKIEDPREKIDPMTRINFSKACTVEHNVKVVKVGRIPDADDLRLLRRYFIESVVGPDSDSDHNDQMSPVAVAHIGGGVSDAGSSAIAGRGVADIVRNTSYGAAAPLVTDHPYPSYPSMSQPVASDGRYTAYPAVYPVSSTPAYITGATNYPPPSAVEYGSNQQPAVDYSTNQYDAAYQGRSYMQDPLSSRMGSLAIDESRGYDSQYTPKDYRPSPDYGDPSRRDSVYDDDEEIIAPSTDEVDELSRRRRDDTSSRAQNRDGHRVRGRDKEKGRERDRGRDKGKGRERYRDRTERR